MVTISNFGGSPLLFNPFAASGDFGQTNTCGSSLAGGDSCTVAVTFSPTATGTRTGALTIGDNSNNLGGTQSVALAGTGTAPVVSVGPAALAFESRLVNTTSAAQEVVLSNTGTGPLTITNTGATGPFTETNNCGSNVNPGISCAFLVTFTPGGLRSAIRFTERHRHRRNPECHADRQRSYYGPPGRCFPCESGLPRPTGELFEYCPNDNAVQ